MPGNADIFYWDAAVFLSYINDEARRLMRRALTDGRSLKPPDAIHLATAIQQKVTAVHTYDERLHGYGDITGLDIEFPAIPTPRLPL